MRIPHRHLSRREAERLLDDPAAHDSALGAVLKAAGGPALPGELGREDATAATFQRTATVPSPGGGTFIVPTPRREGRAAVRAVVATGAVVALATGGFALAGSADLPHIPGLPGQASDRATESVAKEPKPSEASSTSATPGDEASETGGSGTSGSGRPTSTGTTGSGRPTSPGTTGSSGTSTPSASSSPTPNFEGLCRAFQATDHSANGSSLDSAAFRALAAEAGGADQVATYCVGLIGEPKPTGKPTDKPTGKPTDKPTGKPSSTPTPTSTPTSSSATGKPTDTPTGKPSSPPGKPTEQPSPTDSSTTKGGGRTP